MLDFRIIHDGKHWIADKGALVARGRTLEELDRNLAEILAGPAGRRFGVGDAKEIDVRMTFDNVTIPEWMRQYSNHYFNRIVTLSL